MFIELLHRLWFNMVIVKSVFSPSESKEEETLWTCSFLLRGRWSNRLQRSWVRPPRWWGWACFCSAPSPSPPKASHYPHFIACLLQPGRVPVTNDKRNTKEIGENGGSLVIISIGGVTSAQEWDNKHKENKNLPQCLWGGDTICTLEPKWKKQKTNNIQEDGGGWKKTF